MSDETGPKVLGHAYWLPGMEGFLMEHALAQFVNSSTPMTLTLTKVRNDSGQWFYTFTIDKPE